MSKCEKCIHKPICEWVDNNFKDFSLCKDEKSTCILFHEKKEINCTNLSDFVEMMLSSDYKERFKAEYYQTKIRYEKLKNFCNKIEAAEMAKDFHEQSSLATPKHDCPLPLLREQQHAMGMYLHALEIRAVFEKIEL